jgi:hypothetical protein
MAAGRPEMGFHMGRNGPQWRVMKNASFLKDLGEKIKARAVRCTGIVKRLEHFHTANAALEGSNFQADLSPFGFGRTD